MQRKQTVFLLLAIVAVIACLCMRLLEFLPENLGIGTAMTNFCLIDGNGSKDFSALPLAILLLLALPDAVLAIFSYKNRRFQASLCVAGMLDMVLWYAYLAFMWSSNADAQTSVGYVAVALPLVALVLFWLARRGILADEALVRAADRIR